MELFYCFFKLFTENHILVCLFMEIDRRSRSFD